MNSISARDNGFLGVKKKKKKSYNVYVKMQEKITKLL